MTMKTRAHFRRSRGQAAVEMALLTIILVPVILYVLFIDDLLRFKLDQEETMIATGWDLSVLNYDHQTTGKGHGANSDIRHYIPSYGVTKGGQNGNKVFQPTQHGFAAYFNRMAFGDHTSATPRFDDYGGGSQENHHLAVGAHQCWLVGKASGVDNQVDCERKQPLMAANYGFDATLGARTRMRDFLMQGAKRGGGYISCQGRVGVINHWLPSGILFFSKEELSSRDYHHNDIQGSGSGTHGVAEAMNNNTKTEAYQFPIDRFGMVTNTWAMTDANELMPYNSLRFPGQLMGDALYDRTVQVYNATGPTLTLVSATKYPLQAIQRQVLGPQTIVDLCMSPVVCGDLMMTPEVAFKPNYDPKVGNYYSSQYWDFGQNRVQKTYSKRGTWYLGNSKRPP
jgi:hypothetical protein